MDQAAHPEQHRWSPEPLEETLDGARRLTVSVVDAQVRAGWEQLAALCGIPRARWRAHHPVVDGRVVALVDGRAMFDVAAWQRLVSLVPGAVALPARTAAELGLAGTALRPPGRPPARLLDLWRARRRRRRLRRAERTLEADVERWRHRHEQRLLDATAPGDDGTPLEQLPAYALASRIALVLDPAAAGREPALVDLLLSGATAALVAALQLRGLDPNTALAETARRASGGGAAPAPHLDSLAAVAADRGELDAWRDSLDGWHALRALHLEAEPLRELADPAALLGDGPTRSTRTPAPDAPDEDPQLETLARRARRLSALREALGSDRARTHAALRRLTHALARRLHADGLLPDPDLLFDLELVDLRRAANGSAIDLPPAPAAATAAAAAREDAPAPALPAELQGIAASRGTTSGPVLVLDTPTPDAPVDGAVLVCRVTDPAWTPLLQRCAALVTERGGPLSHAAIVARELELPAVVGCAGACATARAASHASVDGSLGRVRFSADPGT